MRSIRWGELVVPGLTFIIGLAYWLQVKDQSRVVIWMPKGILAVLLVLIVLVVWKEAIAPPAASSGNAGEGNSNPSERGQSSGASGGPSILQRIVGFRRELGIIALSFAYYWMFERLGFSLSNAVYLMAALTVAGLHWKKAIGYTVITTLILHAGVVAMQLNVPGPPWGY